MVPLIDFWGHLPVSAITGNTCRRYTKYRGRSDGTVRRELGVLRAAVEYCLLEGYITRAPRVHLPDRPVAKDRWLTRDEVAHLIRAARSDSRSRHVAWFILIALYTGTRSQTVLGLRFVPQTRGGWIDCQKGVIYRAGQNDRKTTKRKPPVRMPRKLLGHMKRRQANGANWAVEFRGHPVSSVKSAFARSCRDAGLEGVSPHTLKHTAVTWAMFAGVPLADAAGYFGTSIQTLERVYFHHHVDFQRETADAMDGRK